MTMPARLADQLSVLDKLEGQIVELRNKSQSIRDEAKTWAEKRDALNAQNKKIWEEVKELKFLVLLNRSNGISNQLSCSYVLV